MTAAKKDTTAVDRAWEVRRNRIRRIVRQFAVLVGVPTILAVLYYGLWAADEYVSVTVVTVQSPPDNQDELGGSFVANRADDVRLVRDSILSRTALDKLIAKNEWKSHYVSGGNFFSSLEGDAGSENAYEYFIDRVDVQSRSGEAVRLAVRAFSPEAASTFAKALLESAEVHVNEVALRPLYDQAKVVDETIAALKALITAAGEITDETESLELISARTELAQAEALAAKISMAQIARRRYLTVVSGPSIPNEAAYPRRLWSIATVFVVAFALMGIFSLLLGAVREHAKV